MNDIGYAARPDAPSRAQGPLTIEVMEALNRAQDISNEVRHRLYELKARLFGAEPENGAGGLDPKRTADCFTDAHSEKATALHATLGDIDRLSTVIANRL